MSEHVWENTYEDVPHEECGVFGAYDFDGGDVAPSVYYGLFSLQHRGQESCGIAVNNNRDISYPIKGWDWSMKYSNRNIWKN